MSTVDPIFIIVIFILICRLFINIVEFYKPLSKLDLPTVRQGSRERKNATGKKTEIR